MLSITNTPVMPGKQFVKRYFKFALIPLSIVFGSLAIGIIGYHLIAGLSWVDSVLESSMILGGMGPVNSMKTDGSKLFASFYSLYSGLVLISTVGLFISPIIHRFLHKFHVSDEDVDEG